MAHPARMARQPGAYPRVLVDGIVVHDRVYDLAGRDCCLDGVEKADEFLMTVALHAAAQHRAVEHVQGRKQRGRAMPLVVMRHGRGMARADGRAGSGAAECLDLALLINGQDHRVRGWADVEPDDVLHLLGKRRIVRALEGAHAMGLDAVGPPDPLDRAQREADPLRDGAPGPVGDLAGRLGAGDGKDLSDGLGRHGRLAGWTRLVPQQSLDAFFGEALLPAPHRGAAHADAPGDLQHGQALVGAQNDARPLDVLVQTVPVGDESREALTITGVEEDARGLGHAPPTRTSPPHCEPSDCVSALAPGYLHAWPMDSSAWYLGS